MRHLRAGEVRHAERRQGHHALPRLPGLSLGQSRRGNGGSVKLYRTTIVIWSEYATKDAEIAVLALEATQGNAYCSSQSYEPVVIRTVKDWEGVPEGVSSFFGLEEPEPSGMEKLAKISDGEQE